MSHPVETLDDWNKLLSCCCEMPSCPVPLVVCKSQIGNASSDETDYTDAVLAWEEARDEWVAEEPGRLPEDYPVPPPEEPEDWTEYDRQGSWLPFDLPPGDPSEDVPSIYRFWRPLQETDIVNGTFGSYYALDSMAQYNAIPVVDPERDDYYVRESNANLRQGVVTDNVIGGTFTSANYYNHPEPSDGTTGCTVNTIDYGFDTWSEGSASWTSTAPERWVCTATTSMHYGPEEELVHGSPVTSLTCPGPWGTGVYPSSVIESSWADLTRVPWRWTYTLSDGITKAGLAAKAAEEINPAWDEDDYGTSCIATYETSWPTIESVLPWGPCESDSPPVHTSASPRRYIAATILTAVRVQFKVPITHTGTYFAVLFDVINEPDGWEEENGPPRTWHAQNISRIWTGPGTGDQDNPSWNLGLPYDIDPPDEPGQRRIVNIRFWCYPSSPYGYKPQVTGEGIELPDP